jgi:hypothetical protein
MRCETRLEVVGLVGQAVHRLQLVKVELLQRQRQLKSVQGIPWEWVGGGWGWGVGGGRGRRRLEGLGVGPRAWPAACRRL